MKYILLFICRILNIIYYIIGFIFLLTFPIWPLFAYLFGGSKVFEYDPGDWIEYLNNIMHYPLDIFEDYIDNIDDKFSISFNSRFWQ